jgi:hypothetical protein
MDDFFEDQTLQGFLDQFKHNVTCNNMSWYSFGSGRGFKFQDMCKRQPAFACETAALTLRQLRQHYGTINRYEVELAQEADNMLREVQNYLDAVA